MNRRERRAGKSATRAWTGGGGFPRPSPAAPLAGGALARALALYQSGRLPEAERAYRRILRDAPHDPDALYQFGILAGQMGRLTEAEHCLAEAAALRPGEPAVHHALGLIEAAQDRPARALARYDKALALDAGHVGALVGRADALHDLGDLAQAESTYRRAAALAPRAAEVRFGWATVLADLGRLEEAARTYAELLRLDPGSAAAHVNLGAVLRDLGRIEQAAVEFQRALELRPDIEHALPDLVAALCLLGRSAEALELGRKAMRRDPQSPDAQRAFAAAVARSPALDYSPEICGLLERCLSAEHVAGADVARTAAWQLRQKYGIDASPSRAAGDAVDQAAATSGTAGALADPLLHRLLAGTVNSDLTLEAFLTGVRRRLCMADNLPAGLDPFLAVLALQCFNNGHVFAADAEEEARVAALRAEVEAALERSAPLEPALERKLLRLALYEPLAALAGAKRLIGRQGSSLGPLLARCLAEPLEEAELAQGVPSLGTIENAVSRLVRDQYEESPYPRWFSLPKLEPASLATALRRKFPGVPLAALPEGPIEILVAGCGTGRQPIATALSLTQARVLAVDLSRASLGYAKRMALRLGVSNIDFLRADLLELGRLGRDFAAIEAVGVLHHMEEPMAGWRVLCGLLRPGGLMRIGLYSALARADVVAARARIAALGLAPTARDIRAFRQRVLFGEEGERMPSLANSADMFDLNGCRDLLFHTKEHRYTPLDLQDMLARLGLEFVGFEHPDQAVPLRYRAEHPGDPAMTDLAQWARFEEAHRDAFAGMFVFWCRKPPAAPTG